MHGKPGKEQHYACAKCLGKSPENYFIIEIKQPEESDRESSFSWKASKTSKQTSWKLKLSVFSVLLP